jgi:hypothetical protein
VNDPNQDVGVDNRITQSETSLAAFGSYVLMGFNDSNCAMPGGTVNFSSMAFSSDGGMTWCDCGSMPRLSGGNNLGDPVVAVDSQGVFYYTHLGTTGNGRRVVQLNTGVVNPNTQVIKIGKPRIVGVGERSEDVEDKEWIATGPDSRRPGKQAVYVTWSDFGPKGTTVQLRFTRLTSGRRPHVLVPPKTIDPGPASGSFPVVDACGNLYVFYEGLGNGEPKSIRMLRSTDGGETFGRPVVVSEVVTAGVPVCGARFGIEVTGHQRIRLTEFPHAAVGPDSTLYVVWNDGRNQDDDGAIDVFLAFSTDQGDTWIVKQVTDSRRHSFMPSVAADYRGAHVQYSQFCGSGGPTGDKTFALFMTSLNVEKGFSRQSMVSTVCSPVPVTDPNFDPVIADCYMGDYNQIIAGHRGALLHSWGDNRHVLDENRNPDVFFIQTGPECPKGPPPMGTPYRQ